MFSALRQGDIVYVAEKTDGLKVSIGTVSSTPRPRYNISDAKTGMGITVIDIDVKTPEQEYKFEGISPSQSIADYGNAVISDNREAMMAKVEALCDESDKIIRDVELDTEEAAYLQGYIMKRCVDAMRKKRVKTCR